MGRELSGQAEMLSKLLIALLYPRIWLLAERQLNKLSNFCAVFSSVLIPRSSDKYTYETQLYLSLTFCGKINEIFTIQLFDGDHFLFSF